MSNTVCVGFTGTSRKETKRASEKCGVDVFLVMVSNVPCLPPCWGDSYFDSYVSNGFNPSIVCSHGKPLFCGAKKSSAKLNHSIYPEAGMPQPWKVWNFVDLWCSLGAFLLVWTEDLLLKMSVNFCGTRFLPLSVWKLRYSNIGIFRFETAACHSLHTVYLPT